MPGPDPLMLRGESSLETLRDGCDKMFTFEELLPNLTERTGEASLLMFKGLPPEPLIKLPEEENPLGKFPFKKLKSFRIARRSERPEEDKRASEIPLPKDVLKEVKEDGSLPIAPGFCTRYV